MILITLFIILKYNNSFLIRIALIYMANAQLWLPILTDIYNCLPFSMFITRPNNYESNRLSYQDEAQYGLFRKKASPGLLI